MKPLSIYIHIPFCKSKCHYCDFLSAPVSSKTEQADYTKALLQEIEIEALAYQDYQVKTVFIGGGTPSILPAENIEAILCKLKSSFNFAANDDTEITIEINPGTITGVILSKYRAAGINRLSFGLQSANNNELKLLGRIHTYDEFLSTYNEARNLGFQNINIDLISAIPGQSFSSWKQTLEKVSGLLPEHISAYSLIIEPGTSFHEIYAGGNDKAREIVGEEQERQIYHYTKSYLEAKNNSRYEISNYAKPGYECKHNLTYWRRGDYVGFGLGASSLIDNKRWSNISDLKSYIMIYQNKQVAPGGDDSKKIDSQFSLNDSNNSSFLLSGCKEKLQVLSLKEQIEEYMFLGLRLTEGVNKKHFKKTFGHEINEFYESVLLKLKEQKLIEVGEYITLTAYGVDVSNYVLAEFLF
ncbi:MAG: radical SAM family heme chaperone HemW [Lachnospiraceae bacterium]|nr:radical SAM family heme chaperone HemW [Lachnospiraceae bacterium]